MRMAFNEDYAGEIVAIDLQDEQHPANPWQSIQIKWDPSGIMNGLTSIFCTTQIQDFRLPN